MDYRAYVCLQFKINTEDPDSIPVFVSAGTFSAPANSLTGYRATFSMIFLSPLIVSSLRSMVVLRHWDYFYTDLVSASGDSYEEACKEVIGMCETNLSWKWVVRHLQRPG